MKLLLRILLPNTIPFIKQILDAKNAKVELEKEYKNILNFINKESRTLGIIRNGSLDTHGKTIFEK